jgi:anti-sigma28 factor (negative regulator of flagellin synthesis)
MVYSDPHNMSLFQVDNTTADKSSYHSQRAARRRQDKAAQTRLSAKVSHQSSQRLSQTSSQQRLKSSAYRDKWEDLLAQLEQKIASQRDCKLHSQM